MGKVVWALFLEERDKIEGIWVDLSTRLVSDLQESVRINLRAPGRSR